MRRIDLQRFATTLVVVATLGICHPSGDVLTDADKLFMSARSARSQSEYAHYAIYVTVARFRRGDREIVSTWETTEDMTRRVVYSRSLPREEAANPHVPHGINVGILVRNSGPVMGIPPKGQVINAEPHDDLLGQLTFAVDQDVGLALYPPAITSTTEMSQLPTSLGLPRIGRTGTVARTYEVTDLGEVTEDAATLHHLGLRPLRDPKRHRLRGLWTDLKTSLPVHAVVAGIGNRSPLQDIHWKVAFLQYQGGTYLAREVALEPLRFGHGVLTDVTITFAELRATNRLTAVESLGLSGEVGIADP